MSREKFSKELKLEAIKEYVSGGISLYKLAQKYGSGFKTVQRWYDNYQKFGEEAFEGTHHSPNYSADFKKQVVNEYLAGGTSYKEVALKYGIYAPTTVLKWVKQYNNHVELTDSRLEGVFHMVNGNGRKTTLEEKTKIVEDCTQNQYNYAETAKKYDVSYQQVYSWVHRYKEKGLSGLADRRGKKKPEEEMTELDKLRLENRMLKAQAINQQMEIDFLKKLEEVERRRF
ncbi:helix-turn-helix domain-containing protein [Anaerocolumna chitinilytica]|uniref:Transposase n=1 Tax=Anaerocolumna chitinilytica TaxID=1727145 RepID=A0A7I8DQM7_9FIRM|nr:helix-turn-helix domain-containing protein [Anaerocolumna chitinilytica]BCK00719.1 transposase [Anaerocolumna chitinilytica]BCK01279.1 transposase [Anaerocolumna chitinilytica]